MDNKVKQDETIKTDLVAGENGSSEELAVEQLQKLQELAKNPSTIGFLEFITGVGASVVGKPSNLVLSGGRLVQSLFKGDFYQQLFEEVQKYRKEGKIPDENLESIYGRSIFVELMKTIDEESLDDAKFRALKAIFFNSVAKGTDEHSRLLAYQYFQVCKKLSSIEILVLKTAFSIYEEPGSSQRFGGVTEWETAIAEKMGVPRELVTQARLENSGLAENLKTMIFDVNENKNRHGLTQLGVEIGKFLKEEQPVDSNSPVY